MSDLESILSGAEVTEEVETEAVETTEETPEPTGEATKETEKETEVEQSKKDSTPEPETQDKEAAWSYQAYKDERSKRQDLEKELAEMRKQSEAKPEPVKAPDVLDDQEAYTQHMSNMVNQSAVQTRSEMSKFFAEKEFGADVVTERLEAFKGMAANNAALTDEVLNSPSPYHTMIEIVDKAQKFEELKNVDQLEAKFRGEMEEKIRKEIEAEMADKKSKRESVTPSLNSGASVKGAPEGVTEDLKSILGR